MTDDVDSAGRPVADGGVATGPDVNYREWSRPTPFYNETVKWLVYAGIGLFVAWSVWGLWVPLERMLRGAEHAVLLLEAMFPPNFGPDQRELIWDGMIESLAMSVVATVVGVAVSLPFAFMAAENVAPRPIYYFARGVISISRAFHSLVVAIIAVVAFGFGAFAGVVTLTFATIGFFSKLLAEEIEDISATQVDAIRSTGANGLQVLLYGVVPQIIPRFIGLTVYRWDINIRASTIIGIVGAGGIGVTLLNSFDRYDYDFSMAIILVIVAIVLVGELFSLAVRRRYQ